MSSKRKLEKIESWSSINFDKNKHDKVRGPSKTNPRIQCSSWTQIDSHTQKGYDCEVYPEGELGYSSGKHIDGLFAHDCCNCCAQCVLNMGDVCSNCDCCGGGCGGCFLAGTNITMADGIKKNIETIEIGDIVKSFDENTREIINNEVTKTFIHKNNTDGLILNGFIKTTTNHPFYSNGKWIEAGNLKIGDKILKSNGDESTIKSLDLMDSPNTVYNFEVDKTHTYVVEGYVVHNKGSANCWQDDFECLGCPDPCATNYVSGSDSCKTWGYNAYDGMGQCMPSNPTGDDACSEEHTTQHGCCHYEGCNDPTADNFWCDYLPNSDGSSCGGNCTYSTCCTPDACHAYYVPYCDTPGQIDGLDDDAISGLICTIESEDVYGCMDDTACNYDSTATEDDDSCEYPIYFGWCDCDENVPGDSGWTCTSGYNWDNGSDPGPGYYNCDCECIAGPTGQPGSGIDCLSECGGDAVEDCAGVCEGTSVIDVCGVCGGDDYCNGANWCTGPTCNYCFYGGDATGIQASWEGPVGGVFNDLANCLSNGYCDVCVYNSFGTTSLFAAWCGYDTPYDLGYKCVQSIADDFCADPRGGGGWCDVNTDTGDCNEVDCSEYNILEESGTLTGDCEVSCDYPQQNYQNIVYGFPRQSGTAQCTPDYSSANTYDNTWGVWGNNTVGTSEPLTWISSISCGAII